MALPRRRPKYLQTEPVIFTYDHPALTANTVVKLYKAPAGRTFVLDRALYINPTGLVEDPANNFAAALKSNAAALADLTYTVANATDLATSAAHGMETGDGPYQTGNAGGALPTGLTAFTNYFIIVPQGSTTTFKFATSKANALAGVAIDLTSDGTGTQTLFRNPAARLFNTDSDLSPDVGATLAVNTFIDAALVDSKARQITGAAELVIDFAETGIATLPAGRIHIEGRLL